MKHKKKNEQNSASLKWSPITHNWGEQRIHLQQHFVCDQATENELVPPHPETKAITIKNQWQSWVK